MKRSEVNINKLLSSINKLNKPDNEVRSMPARDRITTVAEIINALQALSYTNIVIVKEPMSGMTINGAGMMFGFVDIIQPVDGLPGTIAMEEQEKENKRKKDAEASETEVNVENTETVKATVNTTEGSDTETV